MRGKILKAGKDWEGTQNASRIVALDFLFKIWFKLFEAQTNNSWKIYQENIIYE